MKRWACCVLAAAMVCSLAACETGGAAGAGAPQSIRIAVSVYDQYDTFIKLLMERFDLYARAKEEETGASITVLQQSAGGSQVTQNAQVESFIESGFDVICVNLVDRTDAASIIDKAEAAGIPVIFFNRELVPEDLERWEGLYYVGAIALQSGQLQGRLVTDLCRENFAAVDKNGDGVVQYVMLEGEAGHQDAIVRTEYAVNTVAAAGFRLERLEDEIANWVRAQADTRMTEWMKTHGTAIELVFANNDDMALGAIDALRRAGVSHDAWPVVVGIDGTREGLAAVQAGEMAGTVLNDADGQGHAMLELACALKTGGALPEPYALTDGRYIRLPYQLVTPQNVQQYVDMYGQTA